jgi:hypothetical protein
MAVKHCTGKNSSSGNNCGCQTTVAGRQARNTNYQQSQAVQDVMQYERKDTGALCVCSTVPHNQISMVPVDRKEGHSPV